jgi:predicted nucleic acid-binding protein
MGDKTFVDSNILVYAHDQAAGEKHRIAHDEIHRLWSNRSGVLSTQVLQETYVTLTQKTKPSLPLKKAKEIIIQYGFWEVVVPLKEDLFEAIDLQSKYKLSFWDTLIIQSALKADCTNLLSEDLQANQKIETLTIRNPFLKL